MVRNRRHHPLRRPTCSGSQPYLPRMLESGVPPPTSLDLPSYALRQLCSPSQAQHVPPTLGSLRQTPNMGWLLYMLGLCGMHQLTCLRPAVSDRYEYTLIDNCSCASRYLERGRQTTSAFAGQLEQLALAMPQMCCAMYVQAAGHLRQV
jgi:hypothetical protein